ncbi:MAG: capsular polysaccharide biosynthesis protein CapF [Candidatus Eremiobacterota bacterium]
MKILITGAQGFVGKNLAAELKNRGYENIFEYDRDTDKVFLDTYTRECDFIFHLAGVNRPDDESEFDLGNRGFTHALIENLRKHNNNCPIVVSSSTQAELNNLYGISKKAAEDEVFAYAKASGARSMVYRLPNIFGKWCRPYYNSVVATFCHNIARGLEITVNDPKTELTLCYIDDLIYEFMQALEGNSTENGLYYSVPTTYHVRLGELASLINSFSQSRKDLYIPDMEDDFTRKLYSTYLSYLPQDEFAYDLKMNCDQRGSFTEFIRTPERGQVSVNVSKPGITKGNHWHSTKNEKFLVVSGKGLIRFRKIDSGEIIEYAVAGDKLQVIDIPPGYAHSIVNVGDSDLVTIMWANECFDPERLDTYLNEF